jgi:hypothetical protein
MNSQQTHAAPAIMSASPGTGRVVKTDGYGKPNSRRLGTANFPQLIPGVAVVSILTSIRAS